MTKLPTANSKSQDRRLSVLYAAEVNRLEAEVRDLKATNERWQGALSQTISDEHAVRLENELLKDNLRIQSEYAVRYRAALEKIDGTEHVSLGGHVLRKIAREALDKT